MERISCWCCLKVSLTCARWQVSGLRLLDLRARWFKSSFFRLSLLALLTNVTLTSCSVPPEDPISLALDQPSIERGRYLVKGLAACGFCHGERPTPDALLVGGRVFHDRYGPVQAANLTPAPTGLKDWSWRDIEHTLRGSEEKAGRSLSRLAHEGYEWLSTPDLTAIIAYLRTLPPVEHEVPKREVGFLDRNITGFSEGDREVLGFIPDIDRKFPLAYGRYLVRNVARCGVCHDGPGAVFSAAAPLAGGRVVKFGDNEKVAPGITSGTLEGIGAWSEQELLVFLRTGTTPEGREVDQRFCPVKFFANANADDLTLIARFLKG